MIIINYDKLYKSYSYIVSYYANKVKTQEFDDSVQDIWCYIYERMGNYDPFKSSFKYYFKLVVLTAFRKIIFDKKKQEVFENSFQKIKSDVRNHIAIDNYDIIVKKIIKSLKNDKAVTVFYGILYNKDDKNYKELAKFLNIPYSTFLLQVKIIREKTKEVIKEYGYQI